MTTFQGAVCNLPHDIGPHEALAASFTSDIETLFLPTIIGYGYKARVGKGLAAAMTMDLLESAGKLCARVSFADGVYAAAEFIIGRRISRVLKTPEERTLLQLLGTEVGRNFDSDIWLKWLISHIMEISLNRQGMIIVIDDCRFQNEIDFVKRHGHAISIRRESNWTPLPGVAALHPSEVTGDNMMWCRTLINNGESIDNYQLDVRSTLRHFGLLA
jgi:hypothetical protein